MENTKNAGRSISLGHPEISETLDKTFSLIVAESDMGAVLISTSIVDQYLTKLFENTLPHGCSKNIRKRLLSYPGPLSTLSAKVDVAYTTRLIDTRIHTSLHILRDIRNKAAHQPEQFKLEDHRDRLDAMYEVAEGMATLVHFMSNKYLYESFTRQILETDRDLAPDKQLFTDKQPDEIYKDLGNHPELLDQMHRKLGRIELAFGVAWMCAFIVQYWESHQSKFHGDELIV